MEPDFIHPYTIKPGQTLHVLPPTEKTTGAGQADCNQQGSQTRSIRNPQIPPASQARPIVECQSGPRQKQARALCQLTASSKTPAGSWAWPADGQLLKRYSDSGSGKGLDIGGKRGQPIRATAGGRIVYQGSGLRGYGQLIIIKHSDEFLSAYAHNDKIYVKEGDVVKRGQKIADMGKTGTDRVKLHFEIRRQGVPTDPLKYLPKR